jgi:hypothetical protein
VPIIPPWFNFALVWAIGTYAVLRGSAAEKFMGAYSAIFSTTSSLIIYSFTRGKWDSPVVVSAYHICDLGLQVVDLIVFCLLMLRSGRYYTIALCSLAIMEFASAVARFLVPLGNWALGTAELVWGYSILAVIAYATFTADRRRTLLKAGAGIQGPATTGAPVAINR